MQIKKAGDALGESVKGKILIYGQSGSGKSWLGVTSPSPLVLLTEKNGFASIAHSNPDAQVIECDKSRTYTPLFVPLNQVRSPNFKRL